MSIFSLSSLCISVPWAYTIGKPPAPMLSCNTGPVPGACGLPGTKRMVQVDYW